MICKNVCSYVCIFLSVNISKIQANNNTEREHENTIIIKSEPIINIGIPTIVVVNIV